MQRFPSQPLFVKRVMAADVKPTVTIAGDEQVQVWIYIDRHSDHVSVYVHAMASVIPLAANVWV